MYILNAFWDIIVLFWIPFIWTSNIYFTEHCVSIFRASFFKEVDLVLGPLANNDSVEHLFVFTLRMYHFHSSVIIGPLYIQWTYLLFPHPPTHMHAHKHTQHTHHVTSLIVSMWNSKSNIHNNDYVCGWCSDWLWANPASFIWVQGLFLWG
jgi:hypothetical protein